jgi:hypothetical protein
MVPYYVTCMVSSRNIVKGMPFGSLLTLQQASHRVVKLSTNWIFAIIQNLNCWKTSKCI